MKKLLIGSLLLLSFTACQQELITESDADLAKFSQPELLGAADLGTENLCEILTPEEVSQITNVRITNIEEFSDSSLNCRYSNPKTEVWITVVLTNPYRTASEAFDELGPAVENLTIGDKAQISAKSSSSSTYNILKGDVLVNITTNQPEYAELANAVFQKFE